MLYQSSQTDLFDDLPSTKNSPPKNRLFNIRDYVGFFQSLAMLSYVQFILRLIFKYICCIRKPPMTTCQIRKINCPKNSAKNSVLQSDSRSKTSVFKAKLKFCYLCLRPVRRFSLAGPINDKSLHLIHFIVFIRQRIGYYKALEKITHSYKNKTDKKTSPGYCRRLKETLSK